MNMEGLKEQIYNYECDLTRSEVKKSTEKLNELLADDFIEFTSSGIEYHYKKGETFQDADDNTKLHWEIKDLEIKELSKDCVLALYKVLKHDETNVDKKYTLRSSIWKVIDEKWKMIFHQGTYTSKF